jgi:hypothetical protein
VYRRWWLWTPVGAAAVALALGVGLGVGLPRDAVYPAGPANSAVVHF